MIKYNVSVKCNKCGRENKYDISNKLGGLRKITEIITEWDNFCLGCETPFSDDTELIIILDEC